MECYKRDGYGESACKYAKFSPMTCRAECTHTCVMMAESRRVEAEVKVMDTEQKLRQYRDVIRPIAANCRAIIDLWEAEEKASEAKPVATHDPRETLLAIAEEMGRGQGPLAGYAERILLACKRAYNAIDSAVCGIDAASSADVDAVRKAADETIGDFDERKLGNA